MAPTAEDTDTDLDGGGSEVTSLSRGGERGATYSSAATAWRGEASASEIHTEAGGDTALLRSGVWASTSP